MATAAVATEPKIITISKVWDNGNRMAVTTSDKERYSTNIKDIFPYLKEGATIKINFSVNGQYKNIMSVDASYKPPTEQVKQEPVSDAPQSASRAVTTQASGNGREASIEAQVAFKGRVELAVAGHLNEQTILILVAWALDKMGVTEVKG
jgi:hypothetical protein